jgi:hypothetical protein
MRIWVDDVRHAPEGYVWVKSVNEAKEIISSSFKRFMDSCDNGLPNESLIIDTISLDHDAGDYAEDGGDYIKLLDWLEWLFNGAGSHIKFHIHSQNPVGRENMRRIIEKNGWKEIR